MHLNTRRCLAVGSALGLILSVSEARADTSSWLMLSGGPSWLSWPGKSYELRPSMQIEAGVGSSPSHPVVVGGLARMTPYFGLGSDMAVAARVATQGFATGNWGVALDAGGFARWWGDSTQGWLTSVQLGAPYGITLSFNGSFGTDSSRTLGVMLGIDLARLTVTRLGGESQWYNPRPAWRPSSGL